MFPNSCFHLIIVIYSYRLLSTCSNFEHAIAKLHGQSESTFISNLRSIVALLYIIGMHIYAMKGLINDVFHTSNR